MCYAILKRGGIKAMRFIYNLLMALLDKKKIEVRRLQWQQAKLKGAIEREKRKRGETK